MNHTRKMNDDFINAQDSVRVGEYRIERVGAHLFLRHSNGEKAEVSERVFYELIDKFFKEIF